jgi:hypothetical protein
MSYRIIRLGHGYGLAIAMTPPDAKPEGLRHPEGTKFYRWADWQIGDNAAFTWNEISEMGAWGYFSGQADGLGWAVLPKGTFNTLQDASEFLTGRRDEHNREYVRQFEARNHANCAPHKSELSTNSEGDA